MMPDDAATLARFDDFLDGLVGGSGTDADGLDTDLVGTVDRVHSATNSVVPDPAFASSLRRSLVQRAEVAPVGVGAAAPLRLTSSPAARLFPTGRWWPRVELAAMVLVIVVAVGSVAG